MFQSAYAFWVCSSYLSLYLIPTPAEAGSAAVATGEDPSSASAAAGSGSSSSQRRTPVKLDPCGSVCRAVEKSCPFFILGFEEDKAAGNPSFTCKGMPTTQRQLH